MHRRIPAAALISTFALLMAVTSLQAADVFMPVKVTGHWKWRVQVGPGRVQTPGGVVELKRAITFDIARQQIAHVKNEHHASLKPYIAKTWAGWTRGNKLGRLITQECTAAGMLVPDSVRVKTSPTAKPLIRGKDYELDATWGAVGRLPGGKLGPKQIVAIDYSYSPYRIDTIAAGAGGKLRLVKGKAGKGVILPPALAKGEVAIVNVWLPSHTKKLGPDNLYPIYFEKKQTPAVGKSIAERLLPKTLAKLRSGQPVKIVAWGDSVTNGGGVGGQTQDWYQNVFVKELAARFPKSIITLKTSAWGGGNSLGYMNAAPGGKYDFKRDVLDQKPDLVTIEFVNDTGLNAAGTRKRYTRIVNYLRSVNTEIVFITPHFIRPDWMGLRTMKASSDPRVYTRELRRFGAEQNIAVADAAKKWAHLWKDGIPNITLQSNSINHPDRRGHQMFADALMEMFPEK